MFENFKLFWTLVPRPANGKYSYTHTQSGAENSLLQFFLTITKSFPPIYLEEMKVVMRVHKATVAYKLVDLYSKGAPWHATNNC